MKTRIAIVALSITLAVGWALSGDLRHGPNAITGPTLNQQLAEVDTTIELANADHARAQRRVQDHIEQCEHVTAVMKDAEMDLHTMKVNLKKLGCDTRLAN